MDLRRPDAGALRGDRRLGHVLAISRVANTKVCTWWTLSESRFKLLDRLLVENHRCHSLEKGLPSV